MNPIHAAQTARCPACGEALRELGSVGLGARSCDACGGFWLDPSAQSLLAPAIPQAAPARGIRCPVCTGSLEPMVVAGPNAIALDRCAAHGIWFDASDLPALKNPRLCAQLARASLSDNQRLHPDERAALVASINAIESRAGAMFSGFVRPVGNPATVGLGPGNQTFMGGVFVASPGRPHHALVKPMPAWIWPVILSSVGALSLLVLGFQLFSGSTPAVIGVVVMAFVFLIFAAMAGGAYLWASYARKSHLVIDTESRGCQEIEGRRLVLWVPRQLMRLTHIQIYTAPRMGTVYDILISLGFAELWVHQESGEDRARELAQTVASCLQLPLDPAIHRKPV